MASTEISIAAGGQWPDDVARLLGGLPEWFGMGDAIEEYVSDAHTLPTTVAITGGEVVGVCMLRPHTPVATEIELLAVRRDLHRAGIGRRLLDHVEAALRAEGIRVLQVKTFGPSGDSEEYRRTRAFYEVRGYLPLEERIDIWGPANPCLIYVKPLA